MPCRNLLTVAVGLFVIANQLSSRQASGDIAAVTPGRRGQRSVPTQRSVRATGAGEILYVVFTFLIGAVVHSIIIGEARCQLPSDCTAFLHVASGEVIAAVTRVDERGQFITEQRRPPGAFCGPHGARRGLCHGAPELGKYRGS